MQGPFILPATNITLANQAVTLAFINVGTTRSLNFLRAWCAKSGTASGQQRVQLNSQVTAFPTLTSQAPVVSPGNTASVITGGTAGAAGTSGINASAEGAGAKTVIVPDAFAVQNGWLWVPTPDEKLELHASGSSGLGLHFPAAAADLAGWNAGMVFQEF